MVHPLPSTWSSTVATGSDAGVDGSPPPRILRVSDALARYLANSNVALVTGVIGGASGVMYDALDRAGLLALHARDENRAVFMAIEAALATGRPAAVSLTLAPALARSCDALCAGRDEGAKLVVMSPLTECRYRGRFAIQEATLETMPADLYRTGRIFDYCCMLERAEQFGGVLRSLERGFAAPSGFLAHVAIAGNVLRESVEDAVPPTLRVSRPAPSDAALEHCVGALMHESVVILVGWGSREAYSSVRELVQRVRAPVLATPRAKGIVPYAVGVGIGGDRGVGAYLRAHRPERLLVLGSRLGEGSTLWDRELLPNREIIQVDIDPRVFAASFDFPTYGIHADIGEFLRCVMTRLPADLEARLPAFTKDQDHGK